MPLLLRERQGELGPTGGSIDRQVIRCRARSVGISGPTGVQHLCNIGDSVALAPTPGNDETPAVAGVSHQSG